MEQDRALWSQEGKDQFLELLKNEVDSSWARKPSISPSLVPFSTPAGPSTPIYQKLDNSQSEIRILELSLSEEDTPITCNLITTPMTKTPEYMALSYGWGDVVDTEEIFVNTHPFQARRNLVAALRQIRQFCRVKSDGSKQSSGGDAVYLWVDAICINQDDVLERTSQVQLMRPTYRKSTLVLSWMGNDSDTASALTVLRGIAKNIKVTQSKDHLWLLAMPTLCDTQYWAQTSEKSPFSSTGNYIWDILTLFTSHSYWTRCWIVQEIVLGKRVLLIAGDETMDVDDLDAFTGQLSEFQLESRPCPPFVHPPIWQIISTNFLAWRTVRHTTNMRWQQQRGKLGSWGLDIVIHTRTQKATDPRDKVFSMVGLAHMGIIADYSHPVESVYYQFAEKWMAKRKSLEHLLIYSGCGVHETQAVKLPSWIPDWSSVTASVNNFNPSFYSAGGNQHFFQAYSLFLGPFIFGSSLKICGVVASTVKSIGNVNGQGLDGSKQHWQFCTHYLARKGTGTYPTGIPYLQAFFRVALRDHDLLKTDQLLSTTGPTFYTLALGFLRTIIETIHYASGSHIDQTLDICLPQIGLSSGTAFADSFSKNFLGGHSWYVEEWDSAEDAIVAHPAILTGLMAALTVVHAENSEKRFFETANGLLGLGPRGMRDTDLVGVFGGCNLPVILRKEEDHYLFVGSCFILGMMKGEAMNAETLVELGGMQILEIR